MECTHGGAVMFTCAGWGYRLRLYAEGKTVSVVLTTKEAKQLGILIAEKLTAAPVYSTIRLPCTREQVNAQEVQQIACTTDKDGYDQVTFICPECHNQHTSYRYE